MSENSILNYGMIPLLVSITGFIILKLVDKKALYPVRNICFTCFMPSLTVYYILGTPHISIPFLIALCSCCVGDFVLSILYEVLGQYDFAIGIICFFFGQCFYVLAYYALGFPYFKDFCFSFYAVLPFVVSTCVFVMAAVFVVARTKGPVLVAFFVGYMLVFIVMINSTVFLYPVIFYGFISAFVGSVCLIKALKNL